MTDNTTDDFLASLASIRAKINSTGAENVKPPTPASGAHLGSPQLASSSLFVKTPGPSVPPSPIANSADITSSLVLESKLANAEQELQALRSQVVALKQAKSPTRSPTKATAPVQPVAGVSSAEHLRCKEELRLAKIRIGELTKEGGDLRGDNAVLQGKIEGVTAETALMCGELTTKLENALGELDMKSAMLESSNSVGKDANGMVTKMAERYEEERERMKHSIDSLQKAHALSVKQARASSESRDVLMSKTFAMKSEMSALYDRAVKAEGMVKELKETVKAAKESQITKVKSVEEGKVKALKLEVAKQKEEKEKAIKSAAEANSKADEGQKQAKIVEAEAKSKITALEKKVGELEGKVKGAAATLQSEVRGTA